MTALGTPPAVRPAAGPPARGLRAGNLLKVRELGIVAAIAVLVVVTAVSNPRFLSSQSIRDILLGTAILAVLAVGQAVVVITRSIDLSVGSVLGLTAFAVGSLLQAHPGLPVPAALLAGLAFGAVCGLLNGVLVRFGKVPALVVTLGTMYVFRGIGYFWAGGQQITADETPKGFQSFGSATVLGVPYLAILAVVILAVAGTFLRSYRPGRQLYAVGSDPDAAVLAGVPVGRLLLGAFVFSGSLAGLAGVLFAARFGTIDASAGTGYELTVVAAVVVGGVAVNGGSGTVYGAALGALLLTVIGSALPVLQIDQFWQQAIVGALILTAIGTDRLFAARTAAALRRKDQTHGV